MKICEGCGRETITNYSNLDITLCRICAPDVELEVEEYALTHIIVNPLEVAKRYIREQASGGNYHLADMPRRLKAEAIFCAEQEGLSLRQLIIKSLELYIKKNHPNSHENRF